MIYEIDDAHAEAAAARRSPRNRRPPMPAPTSADDDGLFLVKVKLDHESLDELKKLARGQNRSVASMATKMVKNQIYKSTGAPQRLANAGLKQGLCK